MAIKCPKCHSDNPETKQFCADCGTRLGSAEEFSLFQTETLETSLRELSTGSTFANRYQIIEELGKGGMGKVYKVFDTKIKEKIALKLIKPEIASDKETIERFSNELRLSRKIGHRNVCRMFDLGEAEGAHFITMEYVHGEDLKSMIRMFTGLTVGTVLSVGKQICDGLAEAHSLGVVHRDLKPQNVMIDKGGNAKIMDFGIARSIREKGITGRSILIGTPEYMSPEQAEAKEVDQRSDIYSLGVILYEMATGRVPFEGDTALGIAMKHKGEMPKNPKFLNPHISDDLSAVILKCLEKDKTKRYQTAGELRTELERIEKGIPAGDVVVPKPKSITSKEFTVTFRLRRVLVPVLIFIAVAIIGVLGWKFMLKKEPAPPPQKPSLAILPFEDLSPQRDQEYFCDGLTDELINRLAKVPALRVPARTSVFSLKGKALDIGEKLQVANVLEGSVRRTGEKMRVTVQLVKVADGSPIWSEKYERDEKDLFSSQDEISLQIIDQLKIELLGEVRARVVKNPTDNAEAYDAYLRGLWLSYNKVREEEWRTAITHFERALGIDSRFSLAYVRMADVYMTLSFYHYISPDQALLPAKSALGHALEIDSQLPEALVLAGVAKWRFEYDWRGAEAEIKKSLELNPNNVLAHWNLSGILLCQGRFEEANKESLVSLELDPLSLRIQSEYGWELYHCRRYDDSIEQCQKTLELDPNLPFSLSMLGLCYIQKSAYPESIAALRKAVALSGNSTENQSYLAYAYIMSGQRGKALEVIGELDKRSERDYVSKYYLASLWGGLGDPDKAFNLLESAYREKDPDLVFLKVDPRFDSLRSDSRFELMLKKIGLKK